MKGKSFMKPFLYMALTVALASCNGSLLETPPGTKSVVITGLSVTASQTGATIAWTTEKPTTHFVEYGTVSGAYSNATAQSQTPDTSHYVTLSGLTASTQYYYRVTNIDAEMSASKSAENTFTTIAFPGIQVTGLAATSSQTTANVAWITDVPTTHLVEYGKTSGSLDLSTIQSLTADTSHSVPLTGLAASTTYYYRVRNFHTTMPATVSAEGSFATTATPVIQVTLLTATPTSPTAADITWTTDVATTHFVEYGTVSGTYAYATVLSPTANTSHSVTLSGLAESTVYYYRVRNFNPSMPDSVSTERSFTTNTITVTGGPTATPSETTADISWTTNVATTAVVDFGTVSGTYEFSTYSSGAAATSHTITLSGLSPSTQYFYRLRNFVGAGPAKVDGPYSFTTTAVVQIGVTLLTATPTSPSAATISWTTDVATTHFVEYGTATGTYAYATAVSQTAATSHSVTLSGLSESTKYYYRVWNFNPSMPDSVSAESSFTTPAITVAAGPTATPAATTANIAWTTNVAATHLVEYGTIPGTYTYATLQSTTPTTSHTITLSGLSPSTQYFYQLRNFVGTGPAKVDSGYTFTTTIAINVTLLTATPTSSTTADITWTTNVATTHLVEYDTVSHAGSGTYAYSTIQSQTAGTSHSVTLSGLTSNQIYYYRVKNYSATLPFVVSAENSFTPTEAEPTLAKKQRGIWMIGGLSTNLIGSVVANVDLYDPVIDTWYQAVTTLPTPVSFAAACSWGGNIYVIGGFNSSGAVLSSVQIYNIAANSWQTSPVPAQMPVANANIHAVVVNNRIYVLGGTTGASGEVYAATTTTYEYTPVSGAAGSWYTGKVAFGAAGSERFALAYGDVIYNFGGRTAAAAPASTHDGLAVSSPPTTGGLTGGQEVVLNIGVTPYTALARTGISGVIYTPASGPTIMAIVGGFTALSGTPQCFIVNGMGATSTPTNAFQFLYYPFTGTAVWANGGTTGVYFQSYGFSSAALSGSIMYVFGGTPLVTSAAGGVNNVYSFDLSNLCNLTSLPPPATPGTWTTTLASMPAGRYGHVAVTYRP